jgi:hypothetical protein
MPNAKLGAKVDRYSFFVRLLPPLLHTGLARRTNILIAQNPSMSDPLISTTIVYNQEAKERQCEYSGGLVQSDDDYS